MNNKLDRESIPPFQAFEAFQAFQAFHTLVLKLQVKRSQV